MASRQALELEFVLHKVGLKFQVAFLALKDPVTQAANDVRSVPPVNSRIYQIRADFIAGHVMNFKLSIHVINYGSPPSGGL